MSGIYADDRITVRPATDADFDGILALGVKCLGWHGDQRDRDFFRWKHHQNPFGQSPAWVAESREQVIGFRTFLRWRFVHGTTAETLDMVRAVDTATDPDFRGRGIFRDLTLTAVEELTASGVDGIFNTPNAMSLPGYLKMGWVELGRPLVRVRPLSIRRLPRIMKARVPADLWPESEQAVHGEPIGALPEHMFPERPTWRTDRSSQFREWRYAFAPLGYRATRSGRGNSVYRLRRRGTATELSLCEVHGSSFGLTAKLRSRADYALALGSAGVGGAALPVPRQGPVFTWRPLQRKLVPTMQELDLCLSDVELF